MNNPDLQKLLSVVIPAHNEEVGIAKALTEIVSVLSNCDMRWEIIIVDDGSKDNTFKTLRRFAENDDRVKGVRLSRNFGKESALLAGLNIAKGDAVITMDSDLQHPPKVIPLMIEKWQQGYRVVDGVKRGREHDGVLTRLRANIVNKIISKLGGINLQNSSDFKLLDRLIVNLIINELPEKQRFYRGLTDWVGFKRCKILFDVEARLVGDGKWSVWSLIRLTITAMVSFTSAPLQIITILGLITFALGLLIAVDTLIAWFKGVSASGFATIIITLLIVGSFIMISLGIIGEYIAKIYDEIKSRPQYIIEAKLGVDDTKKHTG
jgi:glycosyltransferase involved in cell wall biosynthesis